MTPGDCWLFSGRVLAVQARSLGFDSQRVLTFSLFFIFASNHIAGNFRGRKLARIGVAEKTLADCSLLLRQRTPRPQILQRKLSRTATKPRNSQRFSPSKVSHYTVSSKRLKEEMLIHTIPRQHKTWYEYIRLQVKLVCLYNMHKAVYVPHFFRTFSLKCRNVALQDTAD